MTLRVTGIRLSLICLAGGGVLAAAGAHAQSAAGTAQTGRSSTPEELAEVTVTGSRVISNGNDSPTPVTVVTIEDIQATHPTTVFEALLDLPVFAGSRSPTSNPNGGASASNTSGLNLRGLTIVRTLLLYDGHRVPPTTQSGVTDANMIPQMLLQRVDVVTGGASAIYGSDAMAGVTNFITDRKFNGIKANVQGGISDYHDDRAHELGIAGGMDLFGGRGHIEGSYQNHYDAGIPRRTDRPYGEKRWVIEGFGTNALPFVLVPYTTLIDRSFGGKIVAPTVCNAVCASNPLLNMEFANNGVLTPFVMGNTFDYVANTMYGGSGAYMEASSLKAKQDFHQLFGRFDFDLTDTLHYYLTTSAFKQYQTSTADNRSITNTVIQATNAFLPVSYQTQMTSRGITTFNFGKMWTSDVVPASQSEQNTKNIFANTGLEGKLGQYKWEGSYTYSKSNLDPHQLSNINNGRLFAALDAVKDSNGNIVCNVTLTNPGLYPGCVPLNVFGPTAETKEAVNYFMTTGDVHAVTTLSNVSGSLSGAPFHDWAGPVTMSASGEWRRLGFSLTSDQLPTAVDPLICTGLRANCTTFNPVTGTGTSKWGSSSQNRPPVSQTVGELGLESEIPLLTDLRWTKSLALNAAYRYASYKVKGNPIITQPEKTTAYVANIWKLGAVWHFNDSMTLRATRSRDFRAPNLNDLYAPGAITTPTNITDRLTNLPSTALQQTGGNPNLLPETAYTSTVGLVYRPNATFNMAVDAYDVTIANAILGATGSNDATQATCYASGGTSIYCSLQERPLGFTNTSAANAVTKWYNIPINVAMNETWGVDLEANYSTQLFKHPLTLRGLVGYQPHIIYAQPNVVTTDTAGVDFANMLQGGAVWRITTTARYSPTEHFTFDFLTRWRNQLHHYADPTIVVAEPAIVASVAFSDLNLSYRLNAPSFGQADIYLNVQNVFNQVAPVTALSNSNITPGLFGGFAPGDDAIGRYWILGVRYKR